MAALIGLLCALIYSLFVLLMRGDREAAGCLAVAWICFTGTIAYWSLTDGAGFAATLVVLAILSFKAALSSVFIAN